MTGAITHTNYTINKLGMAEIADLIKAYHKDGEILSQNESCLGAYATQIEEALNNGFFGSTPMFLITAANTVNGVAYMCVLTAADIDEEIIDTGESNS